MKRGIDINTDLAIVKRPCLEATKIKRVCFRCKEEGHLASMCAKRLREITPRYRSELGDSLYVVIFPSRRESEVHLRYYTENDNKPTKDGIVLTLGRFKELQTLAPFVDQFVKGYNDPNEDSSYSRHLGGNWYVSVTHGYRCVNIRRFWKPEGEEDLRATRDGIALKFQQWEKLMGALDDVESYVPELRDAIPCMMRDDHMNQMGALRCSECNPNDFLNW